MNSAGGGPPVPPRVDVREPKQLDTPDRERLVNWSRGQLEIAVEIVDNPGGGLLFATQACGQVRAALAEHDPEHWAGACRLLLEAEDAGVRRRYPEFREKVTEVLAGLS